MRVLLVEDDADLARDLRDAFTSHGFLVDLAGDGERADFLGATEPYDVAVLDLGLPGLDGIEVLTRWRRDGVSMPVLILTARGDWSDKVRGFRAGADDYVLKPFRMEEVILRAQTLIRRAAGHAQSVVAVGALSLDTHAGVFTLQGMPVKLTAFEARVLRYLVMHAGRVVSRAELSEHVYDHAEEKDFRSLEVILGRVRRKVGADRIETLRGEGYRLVDPDTLVS